MAGAVKSRFALLSGVFPLDSKRLPLDIIAGVTLAALAVPEVMGYTKIAGMPVITGLYTILLPLLVFAVFGSSRHLVVGADSATAAIMFAGLVAFAAPYSAAWVGLAGWLAILVAVFLILASVFKLGFLADFMSRTVLIGFLTGVGIQVACGQLAGMLGVEKVGAGSLAEAFNALKDIPQANLTTVYVSAGVLLVIIGSKFINKKIPGALIAVIGAIAASAYFNLQSLGVSVLGPVPSGLPGISLPALPSPGEWSGLIGIAASLFLVILAQSAATSRSYAVKYDDAGFKEDKDLVGLSLASVSAGVSGTFPINGSPTKTQMVDSAGGRSQVSQLTTVVIVVIVLLFLTKPLSFMPNAVLASVVFLIGVELVDLKGMAQIYRARKVEFWLAVLTAAVVVTVGVEQGIIWAIVLSLILHVRHSYRPTDRLLSYDENGVQTHLLATNVQARSGLMMYHFGSNLYYANAGAFQDEVLGLIGRADPHVTWFVLEASSIDDIDFTAAETLRKIQSILKSEHVTLVLTNINDHVREQLKASALLDSIGEENIHPNVTQTLAAYRRAVGLSS